MAHKLLLFPESVTTAGAGRAGHQDDGASDGRRTVVSAWPADCGGCGGCGCGIEGGGRGEKDEGRERPEEKMSR